MSQKIVTKVFRYALDSGADRLAISNTPAGLTVDCRLPGGGTRSLAIPPRLEADFLAVLRRLLSLAPGELISNRYGKLHADGCRLDFRLTVRPDGHGEQIILNVANSPYQVWRLNQLGLSSAQLAAVRRFLSGPAGLLVITSERQQGRTSALSSLLLEIAGQPRATYWVCGREGLPAYEIPGANYLIKSTAACERLLRHDSEVIFLDDADDEESLAFACRAATTGRLVAITRQGNDAASTAALMLETAKKLGLPALPLRLVLSGRLEDWPRRSPQSRRTRDRIGRFEMWSS